MPISAYSRKEAFACLYAAHERGATPTKEELQRLILHFAPSVPSKPKTPEQWVARAVGIKDVRTYINYLYSDGVRLVATDGSRAHWCPTTLAQGYYEPRTLLPVALEDKYPDIDRVIPKESTRPVVLSGDTLTGAKVQVVSLKLSRTTLVAPFGTILFNTKYINDAALTVLRVSAQHDTALGESEFGGCVIMPLRA